MPVFYGTDSDDNIAHGFGFDFLYGGRGDDILGSDIVGFDYWDGDQGNDFLYALWSSNAWGNFYGGDGNDWIQVGNTGHPEEDSAKGGVAPDLGELPSTLDFQPDADASEIRAGAPPVLPPLAQGIDDAGQVTPGAVLPTDPLMAQQWHLNQTVAGRFDLNVRGAWNPTSGAAYTGAGVWVVVIDDGFDYNHADLAAPYADAFDYDFDQNDLDPFGAATDSHGTAVMGIIGADNNGTGVVGVAFDSNLIGYRTHGFINDAWLQDIRDSISNSATNAAADVTNISQGIANDTNSEFGVGYNALRFDEIETSIGTAVNSGRGGLGTTIVKSAGNSRGANYDVNADDWTNDTRQVVVAAVDQNGFVSSYSSYGAANLVSGFGTPGEVVTTDRTGAAGYNGTDFTSGFNGTSSAAPMVSGVVALMYDANAGLGWRDVQDILAYSARHVGSAVGGGITGSERYAWQWNDDATWNGGGLHFSNDYGFGLVDATAAVRLSESWLRTGSDAQRTTNQFTNTMDVLNVATVIPDGNATGLSFTGNAVFNDDVERVTVTMAFSTTFTGDLEVYLTGPNGTVSELIADNGGANDYNGTWTFETQAFRGERANGNWTVRVVDDAAGDVLTVSDIVIQTLGRSESSDRYIYTDEYATYAGVGGHSQTLADTNGGANDEINAAAVTSASFINLTAGQAGHIAGRSLTVAAGTVIENAHGGDGGDLVYGNGVGNRLFGNRGGDVLFGDAGADFLYGDDDGDLLVGGTGADFLDGGAGIDQAFYGNSSAAVFINLQTGSAIGGEAAGDTFSSIEGLYGSAFGDSLIGNGGPNDLFGLVGDDLLEGRGGGDLLIGGDGFDIASYLSSPGAVLVNLLNQAGQYADADGDVLAGIETVYGSGFGDLLRGDNLANSLFGFSGGDILIGEGGSDYLDGGAGGDALVGGDGFDIASYLNSPGAVLVNLLNQAGQYADADDDYLVGVENVYGSAFGDVLRGDGVANTLLGFSGGDILLGEGGNDTLAGGAESDIMTGGGGDDLFVFRQGEGPDLVIDFDQDGNDTIVFADFGAGFDLADLAFTATSTGTLVTATGWTGSALLNNAPFAIIGIDDFLFV